MTSCFRSYLYSSSFCLSVTVNVMRERERERERDLVASDCDSAPYAFSYFPIYKVNCGRVSYRYHCGSNRQEALT